MPTSSRVSYSYLVTGLINQAGSPFTSTLKLATIRRSRVWNRTPSYKKVKPGNLRTLAYTDTQTTITMSPFDSQGVILSQSPRKFYVFGVMGPYNNLTPSLTDSALADVVASVTNKAASKVGDTTVSLGVSALEGRKTIEMFFGAARTLVDSYRKVRRGRFLEAAKLLGVPLPKNVRRSRSADSNWLEYRYGWRTLVMDVDGAVRHLAQTLLDSPPIYCVKATERNEDVSRFIQTAVGPAGSIPYYESVTTLDTQVTRVKRVMASIVYKYTLSNPWLSNANQLGLVNPQALVWEVIPFSFVVDWFVNVGEVLTNMTSFYGKTLMDGTLSRVIEYETRTAVVENSLKLSGVSFPNPSRVNVTVTRVYDRSSIGFLSPVPRISCGLNTGRVADAVSLLTQQFSHRR